MNRNSTSLLLFVILIVLCGCNSIGVKRFVIFIVAPDQNQEMYLQLRGSISGKLCRTGVFT